VVTTSGNEHVTVARGTEGAPARRGGVVGIVVEVALFVLMIWTGLYLRFEPMTGLGPSIAIVALLIGLPWGEGWGGGRALVAGLGLCYAATSADLFDVSVRLTDGVAVVLAVPLMLVVGVGWLGARGAEAALVNGVFCVLVGMLALLTGGATWLLGSAGLVESRVNLEMFGRWLLLVLVAAGMFGVAARSPGRAARISVGVAVLMLVGVVRGIV